MEKNVYAIVMASRKLQHYFIAHNISVPTSLPLKDVFTNKEGIVRIGKWPAKISWSNLQFMARNAIKSQALAHFVQSHYALSTTKEPRAQSERVPRSS